MRVKFICSYSGMKEPFCWRDSESPKTYPRTATPHPNSSPSVGAGKTGAYTFTTGIVQGRKSFDASMTPCDTGRLLDSFPQLAPTPQKSERSVNAIRLIARMFDMIRFWRKTLSRRRCQRSQPRREPCCRRRGWRCRRRSCRRGCRGRAENKLLVPNPARSERECIPWAPSCRRC